MNGNVESRARRDGVIGGGPGGPRGRLPPGQARPAVRDPGRERAGRRLLARALGLAAPVHARPATTGSRACRFPAPRWSFPTKDEMGGLPRGLRASASRCPSAPASASTGCRAGRRPVPRAGRRPRFEADHVVVASGAHRTPRVPPFAARARPADRAAPLERVPEPGPAAARAASSSSAPATRARRSRSSWRARTRPGSRDGVRPRSPFRHGSRAGPARPAASSGSSATAC